MSSVFSAFGMAWRSDIPLTQFVPCDEPCADATISLLLQNAYPPPRQALSQIGSGTVCADGYRFQADDIAVLDLYGRTNIRVSPGPAWMGGLPQHFFGTFTAAVIAANDMLPLHASAVAIGRRAILISGDAGAGKSSLAAALIGYGAELIADDLSAVRWGADGRPEVLPGRHDIRLVPPAAALLLATDPCTRDHGAALGNKRRMLVRAVAPGMALPITHCFVLTSPKTKTAALLSGRWLSGLMFRPRLMQRLPGYAARERLLMAIARCTRNEIVMVGPEKSDSTYPAMASSILRKVLDD